MNDRLILTPVADDSEADAVVRSRQLADLASRDAQLTRIEQDVEKLSKLTTLTDTQQAQYAAIKDEHKNVLAQRDRLLAEQKAHQERVAAKGKSRHVAHETTEWRAVCTAPDLCRVGKSVIAFDSIGLLDQQQIASPNVKARGTPVYRQGDLFKVVQADAGSHIVAGTSLGSGHVKILEGHSNVKVNGLPVARQDSRCLVNCNAAGVGGAPGRLVTVQKNASSDAPAESASDAPPGERTSAKLDALKKQKAALQAQRTNYDALDEYVNFGEANTGLDAGIASIQGTKGTWTDYAAQGTRGVLGFVKDAVMGVGELAYEGVKAVPKLVDRATTEAGQQMSQIDGQILAENIRLGNITPGTVGQGVLDIGSAIVKPVTDAWARGDYVEAIARATPEVAGGAIATVTKGSKLGKLGKLGKLDDIADASKITAADDAADIANAAKTATADDLADTAKATKADDGVHVKPAPKRPRPKPNGFDGPDGYKTHGIDANPMKSPEGRKMIDQLKAQGMTDDQALKKAREFLASGADMPKAVDIMPGDTLYKVVPEGEMPGKYSAYFGSEKDVASLKGLSYDQITDRLGIPLESQQTAQFDVVKIVAKDPTTVFESTIARTTQNGYAQPGGDIQTIIANRGAFTDPVLTGTKLP